MEKAGHDEASTRNTGISEQGLSLVVFNGARVLLPHESCWAHEAITVRSTGETNQVGEAGKDKKREGGWWSHDRSFLLLGRGSFSDRRVVTAVIQPLRSKDGSEDPYSE